MGSFTEHGAYIAPEIITTAGALQESFIGKFNSDIEMIEEIRKDPTADFYVVQGEPKRIKVAMPVFIDGKPLVEA